MTTTIKELLDKLDAEIEFAKGTGMPQFVMGLMQARTIVADHAPGKAWRETEQGGQPG